MSEAAESIADKLKDLSHLPQVYQWTGSGTGLEDLFDLGLRHKSGLKPYDYLKTWLNMLRPFAFATQDDSWGEMEKLLCIVMRNYVRLKVLAGEAAARIEALEALVCPTCKGAKRLHVVEGACQAAHDIDCPTCVGTPVVGATSVVMFSKPAS